jgi:hypothetical protein
VVLLFLVYLILVSKFVGLLQTITYSFTLEGCKCDLDEDGECDFQDLPIFAEDWGRTDCNEPGVEPCVCDLNEDGKCDMQDWLLFGQEWGRTDCPHIPTPE